MNRLCRWIRSSRVNVCASTLGLALGCSARVDLGGTATASAPDETTDTAEVAAQTSSLAKIHAIYVSGLAVDDSHLYLMSIARNESGSYYLQRCNKSECWHSLTSIARMDWPRADFELNAGQLGWINDDGLQLCEAPDCAKVQVVQGASFMDGSRAPLTWDRDYAYWYLSEDSAIYRVRLSRGGSGPELVASNARVLNMTLVGDQLYWLDNTYGILRTIADGSSRTEQVILSEQPAWVPLSLELPFTHEPGVLSSAVDGPFIYAALQLGASDNGGRSMNATGTDLVRWRYAEVGASRELLLTADASFDKCTFMRVFDGEVVWATDEGDLWSCRAEACAATKRQLGIDGNVDFGNSITADEQYIYWLSIRNTPAGIDSDIWNVKCTPRLSR